MKPWERFATALNHGTPDRVPVFDFLFSPRLQKELLGYSTDLVALFAVQILHGLTFGAAHLGAMAFVAQAAPKGYTATMQSLYNAVGVAGAAGERTCTACEGTASGSTAGENGSDSGGTTSDETSGSTAGNTGSSSGSACNLFFRAIA